MYDHGGSSKRRAPEHPGRTATSEQLGAIVAAHKNAAGQNQPVDGSEHHFVVAIIPAHNEQDQIAASLASLHRQSRPADVIIVMADNCTDDTVDVAVAAGATVVETVGNPDRKAGALNVALNVILGHLDDHDGVLIMDADTELSDGFLAVASRHLWATTNDTPIGGVGGIFVGSRHITGHNGQWSLVRQLQQNEYVRYARHLGRRQGRALVLTGTGTLFNAGALAEVARARQLGQLPDEGNSASVYDTASLTEDNELTLSLKRLGYRTRSPRECLVYTAMMPTVAKLFEQRRRWQRGALENLKSHGLGRHTAPYLMRQLGTYLGVLFLPLYLVTLTTALIRFGGVDWLRPLWVTVAVVFVVEQTWSVRRGGWRSMGVSVAVIPELWLTVLLHSVYSVALFGLLAGTGERWGRGVDERCLHQLTKPEHRARGHDAQHDDGPTADGGPTGEIHLGHGSLASLPRNRPQWPWRGLMAVPFVIAMAAGVVVALPLLALSAAWTAIAVFVLTGFFLTLGRLIPVPMA